MKRRVFLGSAGAITLSGCIGNDSDEVTPDTDVGDEEQTADQTIFQESGVGDLSESGITLEQGLTTVSATHDGNTGFDVSLVDSTGSSSQFVFVVGDYDGTMGDILSADEYDLLIETDGSWEVMIEQPRADQGDPVPEQLSGDASAFHGPFDFNGSYNVSATHEGSGDFRVEVLPPTGDDWELVLTDLGVVELETEFDFEGIGYVDVEAYGDWSLDIDPD